MTSSVLSLNDSKTSVRSLLSRMTVEAANIFITVLNFSPMDGDLTSLLKNLEQRSFSVLLRSSAVVQPAMRADISQLPAGLFCLTSRD